MRIYMDLVMGLNFAVDLLLLLAANRLSGFPTGIGRAAAAAVLGAVYASAALLPRFSFLGSSFWRLIFLGLMGAIAFGLNKSACRRTGIFVLLSMAMGGIALGLEGRKLPVLILSALGVWFLSRVSFGNRVGGREYAAVTVTEGERCASVIALKDTGNSLRDPITGEQVLVLGPEAAEKLLDLKPEQLRCPMDTLLSRPGLALRLIPYSTVGQPGGMLLARRFASVRVDGRERSALVAFAPEKIGVGSMYQALAGGNI